MDALIMMLVCGLAYIIAYNTYGKFLARKIFKLNPNSPVPSATLKDGIDYVPTKKGIIFGHHYTSIAGTGPIVGPAMAIIWGWLPAILWIVFGSIFMGAVHDFGTLVISMRNEGKSISEVTEKYINKRVRLIFFAIVFLTLLIVITVFGVVIAGVFTNFPSAVVPVWLQVPIAVILGWAVYKKTANVTISTAIAVAAMYLTIWLGSIVPVRLESVLGLPGSGFWVIILLIYCWITSTLPVTVLLQPRDYINAWQLFIAMGMLVLGTFAAAFNADLHFVAPAFNTAVPAGTPSIWPLLFVTIACGAISGFHSLVASGTTPKQIANEPDALFVGYGSMLLEGLLAVLVVVCVAAGIGLAPNTTGVWNSAYASWSTDKVPVVIEGAANLMNSFGLPHKVGLTIMGVFIASFAGTTLDTSVRLQRYVIGELATDLKMPKLANRWTATTIACITAAGLAFASGAEGKGAMKLWPLFGSANQLLASLALLIVTLYLRKSGGLKFLISGIPCLIMLTITNWAMIENEITFIKQKNGLLITIGAGIFLLALWMTLEAALTFMHSKKDTQTPASQFQTADM